MLFRSKFKDGEPELFVRGRETYQANPNFDNPLGTIQSIEHVLRVLDRKAEDEQSEIERQEKALADYQAQLNRTFEHEEKLRELLARQAQLNAALDLDKGERQIAPDSESADVNDTHPIHSSTISQSGGPHAAAVTARRVSEHAL